MDTTCSDSEDPFECDAAIVLSRRVNEATAEQLAQALALRKSGLSVRVCSLMRGHAILLSASTNSLLQWAEDFRLVKRERHTGHLRTFLISQLEQFENSDVPDQFFSRAERQQLIRLAVESVRAVSNAETYSKKQLRRGQSVLAHLKASGVVSSFFPLHSEEELKRLRSKWVTSWYHVGQPIDEIRSYFDSSIAFYFSWLEFYTVWLSLPALFGLFFWLFQPDLCFYIPYYHYFTSESNEEHDKTNNNSSMVVLITFNAVWFAFFQKYWKRKSSELAFRWGAIDNRESSDQYLVEPRPLFTGRSSVHPVTGKRSLSWPPWRRRFVRYAISLPVTLACLWLMMSASVFCLRLQKYYILSTSWPAVIRSLAALVPLILFVCVLNLSNNIYKTIAKFLNDLENHYSQNDYVKQLQAKLVVFRFFNSFLPLFYTAFYERDFQALQDRVAALVMLRQIAGNAFELLWPYLYSRIKHVVMTAKIENDEQGNREANFSLIKALAQKSPIFASALAHLHHFLKVRRGQLGSFQNMISAGFKAMTETKDSQESVLLNQVQNESLLPEFDDCFEDYLEMFCQLGYIMLFSVACPLVAFWCFLNNLIEMKTDALKMCIAYQRPFARERVRDIGIWTKAFDVLAVAAVVVNIALAASFNVNITASSPASLKTNSGLLHIVIVEHAIFLLRALVSYCVNDVPSWIHIELAKREYALATQSSTAVTSSTKHKNI